MDKNKVSSNKFKFNNNNINVSKLLKNNFNTRVGITTIHETCNDVAISCHFHKIAKSQRAAGRFGL